MNDEQLARNLQTVGKECFVSYFSRFADPSTDTETVAQFLKEERPCYTIKSCRSRVSHARTVINAGRGKDALTVISRSNRLDYRITIEAKRLIQDLRGFN